MSQQKGTKMKRFKNKKSTSNKKFKKGMNINNKNIQPAPTRGGHRL